MPGTATPTESRERTPSAVLGALTSVNLEPGLAHDASEEVQDRSGEDVVAAVKASEDRANARFDMPVGSTQSLQRDVSRLRWMIGIGFALLSSFSALSTVLRS